jgi:hypothetical protein
MKYEATATPDRGHYLASMADSLVGNPNPRITTAKTSPGPAGARQDD